MTFAQDGKIDVTKKDSYEKLWQTVERFKKEGLPKSADATAILILEKAKDDRDFAQLAKAMKQRAEARMDISADSIITDVEALEGLLDEKAVTDAKDAPARKAILHALLASVYQNIDHSRLASFDEEQQARCKKQVIAHTEAALADMEALSKTDATPYKALYTEGADSRLYDNDVLSLLLDFTEQNGLTGYEENHPEDIKVALLTKAHQLYQQQGRRNPALLTQLRIWELQTQLDRLSQRLSRKRYEELLRQAIEQNADIEAGADACMAYYHQHQFKTQQERLDFVREARERHPQSKHAKAFAAIAQSCFDKEVSIGLADHDVVAGRPVKLSVSHRNVPKVHLMVTDANRKTVMEKVITSDTYDIQKKKPEDLKNDTLEIDLNPGTYYATVEAEGKKAKTEAFSLTSLRLTTYSLPGEGQVVCVNDAITGLPVPKCRVNLFRERWLRGKQDVTRTIYQTDANGQILFDIQKESGRYYAVAVRSENDESGKCYINGTNFDLDPARRNTHYDVFTDRAIYRPGQTIHVSGYMYVQYKDQVAVEAKKTVKAELRDANRQTVETKELTTDEYGMATVDFVIPKDRLNGNFTVRFGDASRTVKVEEYKRPTFDITFDEQKDKLSFGDTVTVTGVAKTYYGVPVQGAKVTVDVSMRKNMFWSWWYNDNWEDVNTLETVTDDEGRFSVKVYLDGDLVMRGEEDEDDPWMYRVPQVMHFKVNALVTDQGGESHEQSTTLRVSDREYALGIEGASGVDRDKGADFKVKAVNVDGNPVEAAGEWELRRYVGKNEDPKKEFETVAKGTFTANEQLAIAQLPTLPLGSYKLVAKSKDKKGNDCEAEHDFVLYSTKGGDIKLINDWLYTPSAEFGEGKPIDLCYAVAADQPFVYAYLISHNKVERRKIETYDNKIHHLHIDYKPEYKDGLTFFLTYVKDNVTHQLRQPFVYVRPEKQLKLAWSTFRDRLQPGQQETWTLTVKDKGGKPVAAQLLAAMYDASLDALNANSWPFSLYFNRQAPSINVGHSSTYLGWFSAALQFPGTGIPFEGRSYNMLQPFEGPSMFYRYGRNRMLFATAPMMKSRAMSANDITEIDGVEESLDMAPLAGLAVNEAASVKKEVAVGKQTASAEFAGMAMGDADNGGEPEEVPEMELRSDFAETAFFYPDLVSDENGEAKLSFTLPESLTTWKFMSFAHTKGMDYGKLSATVVATKDFMVRPNMPRFVRTGDKMTVTTRIVNQCEQTVSGKAYMKLVDPNTDKTVYTQSVDFTAEAGKTTNAQFSYNVTDEYDMLVCEISATDGTSSDGERNWLPVLSDKKFVTETVPFYIQGESTKAVDISSLFNHNSPTATKRRMVVDYTDNPAWNVVLALHGVMTPKDDCAIDWAASLYVNKVAQHLAKRMPRLQTLIRQWESEAGSETTMTSELAKNQELKDILLQEAPWMLDAQDETEQRHKIAELFNQNLMDNRIKKAVEKLKDLQLYNGAWTWFKGMKPSYYTTFAVCDMLSMLQYYYRGVGETPDATIEQMLQEGLSFLDEEELKDYEKYYRKEKKVLPPDHSLHYMYMSAISEHKARKNTEPMINDYLSRVSGKVTKLTMYGRANCAITLQAYNRDQDALAFVRSLREYTVEKPGMGRYFDTEQAQYSWCDYRLPTHIATMKAMMATRKDFKDADNYLNDMQIWLLRQKETQKWNSVINTIKAVDILLALSPDTTFHEAVKPTVVVGTAALPITNQTAGIGYSKEWVPETVVAEVMKADKPTVTVTKHSPGISWGCVYGQSLEQLDRMEQNGQSLTVERKYYVEQAVGNGKEWVAVEEGHQFKVGDKVRMRHIITADRDMDFVQVRSQHAACLEPQKVLSGYQMLGGRGGYLALHDASADFFFDWFMKGTATVDLDMYVTAPGNYSNGIATVQCAYAPAYAGHSKGDRIECVNP